MRDDPGFWWNFRWFTRDTRWFWLAIVLGMIAFAVWRVVNGW